MVIFSDCKVNIGLNVVSKRADGYHDIETCMVPLPWHDIIEILPAKGTETTLTVIGNKVDCPPEKNLVMKAYRALKELYDIPEVDIILQKVVPDGAGLGGGSSDASHTLRALNTMFGLGIDDATLAEIAKKLGADCPLFIYDRPMIAEGIGDILTPIDLNLSDYTIVIVKPHDVNISTREAYSRITPQQPLVPLQQLLQLPIEYWKGSVKNDFETSVFEHAPAVKALKEMMYTYGAEYASMSGSGSSVYGLFRSDKMADRVLESTKSLPHMKYTFL